MGRRYRHRLVAQCGVLPPCQRNLERGNLEVDNLTIHGLRSASNVTNGYMRERDESREDEGG